jgi:hypothetical protein
MQKIVNRVLVDCTEAEVIEMQAVTNKVNSNLVISAELEFDIRYQRDRLLSDTDWMALSDNTMTPAWASYRQALRDVPSQEGFPYSVTWPTKP